MAGIGGRTSQRGPHRKRNRYNPSRPCWADVHGFWTRRLPDLPGTPVPLTPIRRASLLELLIATILRR